MTLAGGPRGPMELNWRQPERQPAIFVSLTSTESTGRVGSLKRGQWSGRISGNKSI